MTAEVSSPIGLFERYLSLWVALCIAVGVGLGVALPGAFEKIASLEYASVNLVVAIFNLGDDLPNDGQCRFRIAKRCG